MVLFYHKYRFPSQGLFILLIIWIIILFFCQNSFLSIYAKEIKPYELETSPEISLEIKINFPHIPAKFIPPSKLAKIKRFEKIIFRDSETIFSLPVDSSSTNIFNTIASNKDDIKTKITDSTGNQFIINTEVDLPLNKANLITFQTETVPKEVAEGNAILSLLVNNESIGGISVFISKSLAEEFNISSDVAPFIKSISAISITNKTSHTRIVKFFVGGKNFFRDILLLENPGITKSFSTKMSLFPSVGFRKFKSKVLIGQEIIVSSYRVKNRNFEGNKFVLIFSPFGVLIEKIKIPRCEDQCAETIQFTES